ncbi:MAG: HlyD family efflux transporter periplasmic adaptor subunit [Chitinophaga sp.]|uniref:efflux RND transporter periplasmic adaptor subunit n=1 Tax=Chitinophaga sp. TaxID=1869181 RepID=UPI0025C1AEE2|nr:HlyD family efflux transporter periplasmic adaptor subunit [Chitinophaga sp.]MBV8251878.1 HlyD family efflux transporter periplasmic adaptor subunit [Chitinophaga sp.]
MSIILVLTLVILGCNNPTVIYPTRKDIIETVYASGKITSENEYNLYALSNGTIIKKMVKDGDIIHKGQVIYVIRNTAATAKLDAAAKNYDIAQLNLSSNSPILNDLKLSLQNAIIKYQNDSVNYHRWKNLWDQGIGSKSNLDNTYSTYLESLNQKKSAEQKYNTALNEARVAYSSAGSQLTGAKDELKNYFINSLRDGVVFQTLKEEGEAVRANEIVALIGDSSNRVIRLAVDQQDIDKIRVGQEVLLQTDVTGGKIYKASVTRIYPVMNEADQTFRIDAHFTEPVSATFIHNSIEANIIVQTKNNALVLPRSALTDDDSIWIRINGKNKKTVVNVGIKTLDYIEILAGADEKTAVLVTSK